MRNMADGELLLHLDDARYHSPIIGELCRRLDGLMHAEPARARAECPVCQADLRADYDFANEILELKVNT